MRKLRLEKTEGVYGPTLQGEGLNIGGLCAFVRFYGCDFRCNWCDTPFSLGKDKGGNFEEVTPEDILDRIKGLGHRINWIVLSGGNPLAQPATMLDVLIGRLCREGYSVQVETQGSIRPTKFQLRGVDFWSLSPKLPSAGPIYGDKESWKAVEYILLHGMGKYQQLKFVIADGLDYDVLKNRLLDLEHLEGVPIILQPEGQQNAQSPFDIDLYKKSILQLFNWVDRDRDYWKNYDVRILPQYHKILWGLERKR